MAAAAVICDLSNRPSCQDWEGGLLCREGGRGWRSWSQGRFHIDICVTGHKAVVGAEFTLEKSNESPWPNTYHMRWHSESRINVLPAVVAISLVAFASFATFASFALATKFNFRFIFASLKFHGYLCNAFVVSQRVLCRAVSSRVLA